jgi:hypothetical protein
LGIDLDPELPQDPDLRLTHHYNNQDLARNVVEIFSRAFSGKSPKL